MGESGCDVKLSQLGKQTFPFAVECKNQENLNIWAALKQAEDHAGKSLTTPLVVFTRNKSKIYVALPLDAFLGIQSALPSVKRGLDQSARGETHDLGSFAGYAGDPPITHPDDYDRMMEESHKYLDRLLKK